MLVVGYIYNIKVRTREEMPCITTIRVCTLYINLQNNKKFMKLATI